jgi:hypothetical protein
MVLQIYHRAHRQTSLEGLSGYLANCGSACDRENLVAQPAGTVALGSCAARCRRSTRPDAPIAEIAM